jgi:Cu(I)/Ag(I) efflux system protein CusF
MKAILFAAALMTSAGVAHAGEMMKGMEMKDMSPSAMGKDAKAGKHVAKGTVKSADAKAGTVTLDHEPVKSMNWPAMSMTFQVKDKALMDKLAQGKKVEVEFEQRGKDYVITSAK